jgi:hypothetical protein
MKSKRIPGARWFWSQGRKVRDEAFVNHARAVADHVENNSPNGPVPAEHPEYGPTAELSGGATAPAHQSPAPINLSHR